MMALKDAGHVAQASDMMEVVSETGLRLYSYPCDQNADLANYI
jgi:hypothetical protein